MTEPDTTTSESRLRPFLLILLAASFLLSPIAAPDVWWQLSRGRVVASELSPPGPMLTAGSPVAEADWLGGLPFYLAFQLVGFSGLMLFKCLAAGLLLFCFLKRFEASAGWTAFLIAVLILLTGLPAWQPVPRLLDCWFLFLTWIATLHWYQKPELKPMVPLLLVLIVWANTAPLCLLAIPVIVLLPRFPGIGSTKPVSLKQMGTLILLSLLALMLTPRGWFTLADSLVQLFPGLLIQQDLLALTVWQPTFQQGLTIEVFGLSILTAATALFLIFKATSWVESLAFVLFAIPAWTNADALAPSALGIALVLSQSMLAHQFHIPFEKWQQAVSPVFARYVLIVAVLIVSWKAASGGLPGHSQRLGWGIAPELDLSLLADTIGPIPLKGTAHGIGIAPTGMLCWIKADREIRPVRTLRQALLQGHLFDELSLNQELSNSWTFQHPRADGSWGGWWVRLKDRNCQLLLVPNGDERTIRALYDSRWQPMSVDASMLPYGWSGDPLCSPKILELLTVKRFLNRDQWTASPPSPSGTPDCSDWWGMLTGSSNITPALLQAKTFRGMKLYTAALRVLQPLLRSYPTPQVIREFQLCQKELAYQEKLEIGLDIPSSLRNITLIQLAGDYDQDVARSGPTFGEIENSLRTSDALEQAIQDYIHGDWDQAISKLAFDDSETLYAKAQILLEAGDPESAKQLFQQLITQHPDDRLVTPSQQMLDSLQ